MDVLSTGLTIFEGLSNDEKLYDLKKINYNITNTIAIITTQYITVNLGSGPLPR